MLTLRKLLLFASGLFLIFNLAWAQGTLRDPTTPPPGFKTPGGGASGQSDEAGMAAVVPQPTIRITPVGGRQQAAIDGRALQTGDQIKQWRLVNITANGLVLKDSSGTRSVLTPGASVRKLPVSGAASKQ